MRKVYHLTDGRDAWVISDSNVWMPGAYASVEAAELAFEFCDDVLTRLRDAALLEERNITLQDLESVALAHRVCEDCRVANAKRGR